MAGILRKKSQFLDEEIAGLVTRFTFNQMLPAPPFQTWVGTLDTILPCLIVSTFVSLGRL